MNFTTCKITLIELFLKYAQSTSTAPGTYYALTVATLTTISRKQKKDMFTSPKHRRFPNKGQPTTNCWAGEGLRAGATRGLNPATHSPAEVAWLLKEAAERTLSLGMAEGGCARWASRCSP